MSVAPLLLRLHLLAVLAFLLFYGFKAALLLLGRLDTLRAVRARTRAADSLLSLLILGTGGALLAWYPGVVPGRLWQTLALVLVLLPLAIGALRRHYKPGVILSLLGLLVVYGLADIGSLLWPRPHLPPQSAAPAPAAGQPETTPTPEAEVPADTARPATTAGLPGADAATLAVAPEAAPAATRAEGHALFAHTADHGPDGKPGLPGAHDLTRGNLNATGRVYMLTTGLSGMPSFNNQLIPAQNEWAVAYSLALR
ncbi:hypothetical protein [Hymenobacter weizhouensis]|uniref:hypothetical protein n=1 Tax=Hymenobacter sp. YIM 151500-1 TaxID=2987689 RepID=UPI0022264430|nr:hypothetical protein [Hymenobacter sp. YIM 151500-1]UYZ62686.1 hypothetical protein OIS53_17010 [Hymenobacter sp. YIM 151500-1]